MANVSTGETSPPTTAGVSTYEAHGALKSVNIKRREAVIAHDAIAGYMPAMTMSFEVRNARELDGLQAGDALAFRLCVTADRAWIEQLHKTGAAPADFSPPAASPPIALAVGDLVPDIELLEEGGRKVHLSDFRGKTLALTFIYTGCPLPTYCPLMNRNFQTAQTLLARLGEGDRCRFVSLSLDPDHDTPEILAGCARSFGAETPAWTFANASREALHLLGDGLGLEFRAAAGRIDHNLRTIVVDPAGRLRRVLRGNQWTPQELVAEVRSATRRGPP